MIGKTIIILWMFSCIILSGCENNSIPTSPPKTETRVSGAIMRDTVWDAENNPYIVEGDVTVERDVTLTILPEVEVYFDGFYELIVRGTLIANGETGNHPITFTSNNFNPQPKDWKRIYFDNTNNAKSIIKCARIEFADVAIDCFSSHPQITNCFISNNNIGIRWKDLATEISHNLISDNVYGLVANWPSPMVTKNTITRNEYGILVDLMVTGLSIKQNNLVANSVYAICVKRTKGGHTYATENWWGSTDPAYVEEQVYHRLDNPMLMPLTYQPLAPAEITDAVPVCNPEF